MANETKLTSVAASWAKRDIHLAREEDLEEQYRTTQTVLCGEVAPEGTLDWYFSPDFDVPPNCAECVEIARNA
jgi:hypothetical protein